jgi:hypothetical protein
MPKGRVPKIKIIFYFPYWELLFIFVKNLGIESNCQKILREFWKLYSGCEQQLKSWFQEASNAEWKNPNQIKKSIQAQVFLLTTELFLISKETTTD